MDNKVAHIVKDRLYTTSSTVYYLGQDWFQWKGIQIQVAFRPYMSINGLSPSINFLILLINDSVYLNRFLIVPLLPAAASSSEGDVAGRFVWVLCLCVQLSVRIFFFSWRLLKVQKMYTNSHRGFTPWVTKAWRGGQKCANTRTDLARNIKMAFEWEDWWGFTVIANLEISNKKEAASCGRTRNGGPADWINMMTFEE